MLPVREEIPFIPKLRDSFCSQGTFQFLLNKLKKLITNALKSIIKILFLVIFFVNYNEKRRVLYSLPVVTFAGGL